MSRLQPQHLVAVLNVLPECRLSGDELSRRIHNALYNYNGDALLASLHQRPADIGDHRDEIEAAARKLMTLIEAEATLPALSDAGVPNLPRIISTARFAVSDLLATTRMARARARKIHRGGVTNVALDELVAALAGIYTEASGQRPKASRDVTGTLSGTWLSFWSAATGGRLYGAIDVFAGHPPTLEAVDKRTRRLLRDGRGSRKLPIDGNTQNATESATIMASKDGAPDAKDDRRARGSD